MKLTKLTIIFIFILAFAVSVSAQKTNKNKFKVTSKDKSDILKLVFADGFDTLINNERFLQCTIPIVDDKKIILVETIESKIFPKQIDDYQFKFMNREEIKAEVKSNNGDCYFNTSLQFINSNEANVSLWRWIKVITVIDGKSRYPLGWVGAIGRVYKATKEKGKWQIKFLNGTAIVT